MKNDEPAFPSNTEYESFSGMTLRDYFAAKAMLAWIMRFGPSESVIPEDISARCCL